MFFERIELRDFRNYSQLRLDLHPQVNIFVGDNGQGKTNLLEALYVCSRGQTFRHGGSKVLVGSQSALQAAKVRVWVRSRSLSSADEISLQIGEGRKLTLMNEKRATPAQTAKIAPVVLFSPESLLAIKSGPDERRTLVDETVVNLYPERAQLLKEFQHALRSRNRLLKELKQNPKYPSGLKVLETISQKYLELAMDLTFTRLMAIDELAKTFNTMCHEVLGAQSVDISVDYLISDRSVVGDSREALFNAMFTRANQLKSAEIESGTSLVGPHKHDIRFLYGEADSRAFCSQGQQRALILAYKMAQVVVFERKHGDFPVLLLDDVMSELDPQRRENLVMFLNAIRAQIILTTTDFSFEKGLVRQDMRVHRVKQGFIEAGV